MIRIRRSESVTLRFQRKDLEGNVILTAPDDIYFTVKKRYEYTNYVLQKRLSDGGISFDPNTGWYRIGITPEDTAELDFDTYYFDLKKREGETEKYIKKIDEMEICPVVTGVMQD